MDQNTLDETPHPVTPALSSDAEFVKTALSAPRKSAGAAMLIITAIAFWFVMKGEGGVQELLILIGVLVFHELGHLLSMRLFGFTELGMFFLPGFGAAAMGHKPGARASEHAVVSLCGPLPGILIALPMLYWADMGSLAADPMPLYTQVLAMLIFLNLLNLLPIPPLDGGRFFEVLVFARWPVVDGLFRFAAIGVLAWIALQGLPMIGVIAGLMLLTARSHIKTAFASARLRKDVLIPADVAELGEHELQSIYTAADGATPQATGNYDRNKLLAVNVTRIFDRAARQPASLPATIALIVLWGVACLLALGELAYLAIDSSRF